MTPTFGVVPYKYKAAVDAVDKVMKHQGKKAEGIITDMFSMLLEENGVLRDDD